jgi:hypothetical protein
MLLENKNAIIILVVLLSYGAAAGSAGMGSTGPADAATEAFIRYLAASTKGGTRRRSPSWSGATAVSCTALPQDARLVRGGRGPGPGDLPARLTQA